MEWKELLTTWGPLAVFSFWLWKVHRDLLVKRIPREFRLIRRILDETEHETEERHVQHLEAMRVLAEAMKGYEKSVRILAHRFGKRQKRPRRKKTLAK